MGSSLLFPLPLWRACGRRRVEWDSQADVDRVFLQQKNKMYQYDQSLVAVI
jgi:hypothetical protein